MNRTTALLCILLSTHVVRDSKFYSFTSLSSRNRIEMEMKTNSIGSSSASETTSNCIRWLNKIKNFSIHFASFSVPLFIPQINKLLNWSSFRFAFFLRNFIRKIEDESIHECRHKTLVLRQSRRAAQQKRGNFIFFFDGILYDFPESSQWERLTLFGWREERKEWELLGDEGVRGGMMTIKMSSRSLCCKRHKMKSSIHWTEHQVLFEADVVFRAPCERSRRLFRMEKANEASREDGWESPCSSPSSEASELISS